jgi:serine/threonine protein kinase
MKIKITDFGQARPFVLTPQKYTLGVQALFYRAPELLLGCSQYSEKIDLWSIGYDGVL